MNIPCPYCRHSMKLKGVKPSRYAPKCTKCKKAFALRVAQKDGKIQCAIKKIEEKATAKAAPKKKTSPEPAVPAPAEAVSPKIEKTDPDPEIMATGAWDASATPAEDDTAFVTSEKEEPKSDETWAGEPAGFKDKDASVYDMEEKAEEEEEEESSPKKTISLGGYEVTKQLGKGGMGTVFLARQISLDRPVALKVMNRKWAKDPTFLARFIREAYAAAQLVHHNIVQIYDIGEEKGVHYFSMELVKGQTLNDLVKQHGKLDVEEASTYILQAARGLYFAHQQGMIHRDVKPDNLMLNDQGVVKVADLGLVKTPGLVEDQPRSVPLEADEISRPSSLSDVSNVTQAGLAVGTPAYMPPEQWQSAAEVDERADIYSLGCAWYVLLTGKPPFQADTALEVMTKHMVEEPIPPEQIVKRVPPEVSGILLKMLAKKKEDRQVSMGEVITEIEGLLGLEQGGPFSPNEEQADLMEEAVNQFNDVPAARLRSKVVPGFLFGVDLLAILCCFFSLRLAGGILGLGILTATFSLLVHGFTTRSYLFVKFREYILGSRWSDWATWGVGFLLFLALLYVTGLLAYWLAFTVLAATLTAGYYYMILKPLEKQRQDPLEKAKKLLKQIRLRGVPEEGAQQFVCKYGGDRWEEMFEHLFGYERMIHARHHWAPIGGDKRQTFATWRDPLVRWINAQQKARKEAREREHLLKVEQKNLEAQGIDKAKAKQKAEAAADAMVQVAAEMKSDGAGLEETAPSLPGVGGPKLRSIMDAAEEPEMLPAHLKRKAEGRGVGAMLQSLLGGKLRFLIGAGLLVVFALWIQTNSLIPGGDMDWNGFKYLVEQSKPLGILPGFVGDIFSHFNVGVAGLLIVLSAFTKSRKLILFLLIGAVLSLMGPHIGMPGLGPIEPRYASILLGLGIAEFGIVFHRMTRPEKPTV